MSGSQVYVRAYMESSGAAPTLPLMASLNRRYKEFIAMNPHLIPSEIVDEARRQAKNDEGATYKWKAV